MSVSDPLLKKLKAFVISLRTKDEEVTDGHQLLKPLCEILEQIWRKGLKTSTTWYGSHKTEFWTWICKLLPLSDEARINPILIMCITAVKKSKKSTTDTGRGRHLLRTALMKKVLTSLVQVLLRDPVLACTWYDCEESILGNEILTEILHSLLLELQEVDFKLQLKNCCFLDLTWEMPVYRQYELVPSDDLGLDIKTVKGYPLVTQVDPNSVAGEDNKLAAGDVLDEMCGESLRGVGKSGIYFIFNHHENQPIHLCVIKAERRDGLKFGPISRLIERADLSPTSPTSPSSPCHESPWGDGDERLPPEAILPEEVEDEVPVHDSEACASYQTVYLGKSYLGKDGRVNMIEQGIEEVLTRSTTKQKVKLEMGEKDVTVIDEETKKEVMHHLYTEVSACGRRTDALLYYAFIAGETYCSMAKEFFCHVFQAKTEDEAKVILFTIAQGFDRTHLMT